MSILFKAVSEPKGPVGATLVFSTLIPIQLLIAPHLHRQLSLLSYIQSVSITRFPMEHILLNHVVDQQQGKNTSCHILIGVVRWGMAVSLVINPSMNFREKLIFLPSEGWEMPLWCVLVFCHLHFLLLPFILFIIIFLLFSRYSSCVLSLCLFLSFIFPLSATGHSSWEMRCIQSWRRAGSRGWLDGCMDA